MSSQKSEKPERMKPQEIVEGLASVKIYTVANRGEWLAYLVAWFEDGNRKRKQFSDKAAAVEYAQDTARRLADGKGLLVSIPRREISRYQRLEGLLQGKATLDEVVNEYITRHRLVRPKAAPTSTVLKDYLANLDHETFKASYKETLRNYAKIFESAFTMPFDEIMPVDVETYFNNSDQTPKTKSNMLNGFKQIMDWAKDAGYLPPDAPTAAASAYNPLEDEANKVLEPAQLKMLLQHTPPMSVPFIAFSAYTGLPQQEIKRLRWEDVDWNKRLLSTKGLSTQYQDLTIKLSEYLLTSLRKYSKKGGPILEIPVEQLGLRKVAAAAGITWKASLLTRSARIYLRVLKDAQVGEDLGISQVTAKEWFEALKVITQ